MAQEVPQGRELLRRRAEALCSEGKLEEALAACDEALDADSGYERALYLRGVILARLGKVDEAAASLERALTLQPAYPEALRALAAIQHRTGKFEAAAQSYRRAIDLGAESAPVRMELADLAERLGEVDEAIRQRREVQRRQPDLEDNNFKLAALTGDEAPAIAPRSMVARTFDAYAHKFDAHLDALGYRAPELVAALVKALRPAGEIRILDLGCGTGLCGEELAPIASRIVGVDLSPEMIDKARGRDIYDELYVEDLTEFLPRASGFNVIVAADVLIYLGDLRPVFSGVASALAGGGIFVFTVERGRGSDFVVNRQHRYEHSEEYLRRLASETGFALLSLDRSPLRRHLGADVEGLVVALRRL